MKTPTAALTTMTTTCTPADPNLSTLPDADADPTEVVDAGAEYDEDNEDIAPHAFQYQHKKRKKVTHA
jgi:hypothetical protein